MSYSLLTKESMVSLSEPLVDENHDDFRALRADPIGAALWPFVAAAHKRLLTLQEAAPTPERLQEIMKLEAWYDELHDDLVRGVWYLFLGVEFLREVPEERERFRRLRDKLLPNALSSTQRTYRDQSGQAKLASSRLDAEDWELMRRMPLPGGSTVADAVERWFAHAAKLGQLENERDGYDSVQRPSAADILAARNGWIRAIRTLCEALRMRDELPDSLQTILRRIDEVIDRAARRRASQSPGDDDIVDAEDDSDSAADSELDAVVERVMMAGEVIEAPNSETQTSARPGSGA